MPTALGGQPTDPLQQQPGIVDTVKGAAVLAVETGKSYAASAQAAVQPHIDAAVETVQPHVERVQAVVQPKVEAAAAAAQPHIDRVAAAAQPHIDKATGYAQGALAPSKDTAPASSTGIPATSAPLESGPHTVGTTYPSTTTTTGAGVKVGETH